jgi:hypothetical protein
VSFGNPRNEPSRVPPRHRAWTGCHRLWPGRAFIGLLLASRTVTWTVGCAPPDGSDGGKCLDNGCNTYCDDGLQCDNGTNTCVAPPPPGPPAPPPAICNAVSYGAPCGNDVPFSCYGDASPNRACNAEPTDDAGYTLFCCAPECTAQDPARTACGSPAIAYRCDDPLTPESADAASSCLQFGPSYQSHYFCCAPPNTCFARVTGWSQTFDSLCSPSMNAYFCTGSADALPAGETCAAFALDGGFSGVQGYCCAESSDAGVDAVDAGDARAPVSDGGSGD